MAPGSWLGSFLALCSISFCLTDAATTPYCKPLPNGTDWPSAADWSNLNKTVSGRLVKVTPPGIVCHTYNTAACTALAAQWSNTTYHAYNIPSVDYSDETCYPNPSAPCSADGYPVYAIAAINTADVQAGINFAAKTGVRLIIKSTGHDIPQRSSGAGSLSIYTKGILGMSYTVADPRAVALGGIGSAKIYAGERFRDIYQFASQNAFTIAGPGEPGVGISGWVTGGGHGPISSVYGLGADQVIEMEVVTPDGKFLTINPSTNSDLFWAMRGGGGSTFAVMISVTMKVFAPGTFGIYLFSYNTTGNSDAYWSLSSYFLSQLPTLADRGVAGYYFLTPQDPTQKNQSISGVVSGYWIGLTKTSAQLALAVADMEKTISTTKWGAPVYTSRQLLDEPNFSAFFATYASQAVGQTGRVQSRLLDTKALSDVTKLSQALRVANPAPWTGLGHLLSKPGVWKPPGGIAGGSDAVLPAWRTSITHLVLPEFWTPVNAAQKAAVAAHLKGPVTTALFGLAPDSGSYSAESYPTTPNFQQNFYGSNYAQLLSIKNKYDPNGIFWCTSCVGSELWTTTSWSGGASEGIGQDLVKLCRK